MASGRPSNHSWHYTSSNISSALMNIESACPSSGDPRFHMVLHYDIEFFPVVLTVNSVNHDPTQYTPQPKVQASISVKLKFSKWCPVWEALPFKERQLKPPIDVNQCFLIIVDTVIIRSTEFTDRHNLQEKLSCMWWCVLHNEDM